MEDTESKVSPLLRMIAHDLKGLLGTPGLLIHLAEVARDDEELKTHLAALRESFKALDRAVTDLGDLGYAVGDTSGSNPRRTDLRELLEGVLTVARSAGIQRNVELVGELAPAPWPPVTGDPVLLTRMLERLVYWGITHAASNTRLVIEAGAVDGVVRVKVPVGRESPRAVPTVRERLSELEPGTKELGVALPLARETLERYGGTLTVGKDGALEAKIPTEN
jgi:signal transduction histidine kinase